MNKQLPESASSAHSRWLMELTQLPTATGREDRVITWVSRWANEGRRAGRISVTADPFGNLTLMRREDRGADPTRADASPAAPAGPIYLTAHMDHPAFVVLAVESERVVRAVFRGGVDQKYFVDTAVRHHADDGATTRGVVRGFEYQAAGDSYGADDGNKLVRVEFEQPVNTKPGDVMTWDLPAPRVDGDRLHAPACDDLAGLAAALSAFHELLAATPGPSAAPDVRVLLTRAEEVGFIGAIAAAKHGTIPTDARVIALENSKSYPESPIGGGPIVRVGDFTSTFDADLTYRISRIAQRVAGDDKSFLWQRKLMPGGTCEASAYQCYGYRATCLCLPLGNYHNMNSDTGRIEPEYISLSDYHGLVRLLIATVNGLDDPNVAPSLRSRLDQHFANKRNLLDAM